MRAPVAGLLLLVLALTVPVTAAEWRLHGGDAFEQRFSPLDQINRDTIDRLELAFFVDLDTRRGQEATPLMVDGVLYISTAWSKVLAVDARDGAVLWRYDPEVPGRTAVKACCDVVNRGVAYADGRVFVASLDGRLIALDAATGAELWIADTITDHSKPYTVTGAPRVVKDKVLIGNGGGEFGVRGYVSAYDQQDGALVWRFFTVPGDPAQPFENPILEQAAETWSGRWWERGGGGTVWDSIAYDPELDLVYIGVGNGSPWNPALRSPGGGDNLFLSSIVALRPDTGAYVWHFQTTPGDQWDYTATQHMVLADLEIDGRLRQVLMQAPKNGFFYVLDRATGAFISGEAYAQVNWATGLDPETGRPDIVPAARYHETGQAWLGWPGAFGAHNWHPMAFHPGTGLVYIPVMDMPFLYVPPGNDFAFSALAVNMGIDLAAIGLPAEQAVRDEIRRSLKGRLLAWDPVAQKAVWQVDHPGPWNGGVLATAGDLVFQGNRQGSFAAYDAQTGARLWQRPAQTGIIAAPITYALDGEQYVAVLAGWGGVGPLVMGELTHTDAGAQVNRSRLLVYKLDGRAELPPPYDVVRAAHPPPPRFGTAAQIASGAPLYARYCSTCHGDTAVSGGVLPDLRHAFALSDLDTWHLIVRDGALTDLGMVGFGAELDDDQLEAIRAYIVERAHQSR